MNNELDHYKKVLNFARSMRKNPTRAEAVMWTHLRKRNLLELKFLRQYIVRYRKDNEEIAYYIADFYNHKYKLIIEVDGKIHLNQVTQDAMRSEMLNSLGYNIIRFTNEEVLNSLDITLIKIENYISHLTT